MFLHAHPCVQGRVDLKVDGVLSLMMRPVLLHVVGLLVAM